MKIFKAVKKQSLRDFTDEVYPQGSFCFAALLRGKDIKVNGVRVGSNVALNAGDEVIYYTTPKQESKPTHTVVFEDENVLVADKFSGVSTEGLCTELNTFGQFYPVHRLDRNTSGLIVFARTEDSEKELLKAFKAQGVQKTYYAVCKDGFKKDCGKLCGWLKKDADGAFVTVSDAKKPGWLKIITEYSVESRKNGLALVKIILHTGRTHQIRAHMSHIGCPVLGDGKYGDSALNKSKNVARQCLTAKKLTFLKLSGCISYLEGMTFEGATSFNLDDF